MKKSNNYEDSLIKALKSPKEAMAYLNAALEEGDRDTFLLALRDVADAHGGMSKLARQTHLDRVSLYKILSKNGNPEINSLENILEAMGFRLAVMENKPLKFKKAA